MNNFITESDFKIDCALPLNSPQVIDSLNNDYIPLYQKEILKKLFGFDLYVEFEAGLSQNSVSQKWIDLRDGCTYQDTDDDNVLRYVEFLGCKEIVKYYVYYKFLLELQNKVTPTGAIIQNNENSTVTPATFKLYQSWNKLCDLYGNAMNLNKRIFKSSDYDQLLYVSENQKNYRLIMPFSL